MFEKKQPGEHVVVSHGMLGYGFPEKSMEAALSIGVDLIASDAGSTDPGPHYLGSGELFGSTDMIRRDLELLVDAQTASGAKIIIGSCGGGGTDTHVDQTLDILRDVISRKGLKRKVATIKSEFSKAELHQAVKDGRVRTYETAGPLTGEDIEAATHIVGQIGVEPMIAALKADPDIILAGRAWDPGNIAALPIALGYDAGLAIHAGKILECGAQAAQPVEGSDLLLGRIRRDDFIVEALQPHKRCTVDSVAAHTLYEKTNPVLLPGPSGKSDLTQSVFRQLDERRVVVSGSRWIPEPVRTIKLEGARLAGYRYVMVAGLRDPLMIQHIDSVQAGLMQRIEGFFQGRIRPDQYKVRFHRYGLDGVMGPLEPLRHEMPREIGLVADVVGETQAIAKAAAAAVRSLLMHYSYPGRIATAGNLALPFSPAEFSAGPVYEFNIYHLLEVDDPAQRFGYTMETVQ